MKIFPILLAALVLLPACSREEAASPNADRPAGGTPADSPVSNPASREDSIVEQHRDSSYLPKTGGAVVLMKDAATGGLRNDPATISEAYASEKGVQLRISHGGGCKPHTLTLHALETLETSDPPVGHLYLSHDAGGDNCEALITSDMTFDLGPLIAHYRDGLKRTGPVRLMIHEPGKKDPSQSIMVEVR